MNTNIEIHFTNLEETEMAVFLKTFNKTYFVSVSDYNRQLTMVMKTPYAKGIVVAIEEFLKENRK